jgi:hypothetical protein
MRSHDNFFGFMVDTLAFAHCAQLRYLHAVFEIGEQGGAPALWLTLTTLDGLGEVGCPETYRFQMRDDCRLVAETGEVLPGICAASVWATRRMGSGELVLSPRQRRDRTGDRR